MRSIVYVNFAQYDNAGRILDFLLENFKFTVHFSYDHLRLKNIKRKNSLRVYRGKTLIEEKTLLNIRTPPIFLFPSLPLVGILILTQTIFHVMRLRLRYGTFDIYFTVNAFCAWIGILVKKLGLAKKTVFWVWDYFPINYPDWRMKVARWVYWQFDKPCMLFSDHIAFTNRKLLNLRKRTGHLRKDFNSVIVPIGSHIKESERNNARNKIILGFLGMLKSSQGLDLLLDNAHEIFSRFPNVKIEIIGSGPDEERYKSKVQSFIYRNLITFYGFIENDDQVLRIISRWTVGLATYVPDKSNESYWGDPSKIKTYIGLGIPVITTNVAYFSTEIEKHKAGIVINYHKKNEFIRAIARSIKYKSTFQKNAYALAKRHNYKTLYPTLFKV